MKQAIARDQCVAIPANEAGGLVEVTILQVTGSDKRPVQIAPGPLSKDGGHKTFYALFTQQEADFEIDVYNKSDTKVE